jgi:hypothetical protein
MIRGPKGFGAMPGDKAEKAYRPDIRIFKAVNGFTIFLFDRDGNHTIEVCSNPEDVAARVLKKLHKIGETENG